MQCERLLSGPSHLLGRLFFFFSLFLLLIVKVGWRDANPHRMASAFFFFFAVSGVVSFCEGWRPVVSRDANPHGMANANLFPGSVLFSRSSEKSRMM
tara:strand:- start:149 stop:439 length:291 start_codon:yes stop_codon:yes gene_type:complete